MRKHLWLLVASLLFAAVACGPTATPAPTTAPVATSAPAVATTAPPAATAASTTAAVVPVAPTSAPATAVPAGKKTVLRLPEGAKVPQTIDPGITSGGDGLEEVQNFFEGLLYVDQVTGELKPGQAEKYTVSADGLTYTFNLRAGLKWSDGQPLTAKDFEYSWKRQMDPTTKSRYAQVLWIIKGAEAFGSGKGTADSVGIKAADDRTLVVTLEQSAPYFPQLVATWSAYPVRQDMITKYGDKWTSDPKTYIGNGPYRMTEWKQEQSLTAEKNPNYWDVNQGPDMIVWTLFNSATTQAITAYEAGELDHAQLVGADIPRILADPKLSKEYKKFERQGTEWIVFDTTNKPFDDPKVRQALTLATNTKQINEVVLKNAFFNVQNIVAPGVPGSNSANFLGYDLAKAKQALTDAGFPNGQGWPANVKLTFNSEVPADKASAEAIQGMWKSALGIDVVLDPLEAKSFDAWQQSRKAQPFNMYIQGWGSDYQDPNNWYNLLFTSNSDLYFNHWKNPEFDKLAAAGLAENDPAKRTAIYEQADKILDQLAVYLPLYHWGRSVVIKPNVTLVRYRVLGRVQAKYARVTAQ